MSGALPLNSLLQLQVTEAKIMRLPLRRADWRKATRKTWQKSMGLEHPNRSRILLRAFPDRRKPYVRRKGSAKPWTCRSRWPESQTSCDQGR